MVRSSIALIFFLFTCSILGVFLQEENVFYLAKKNDFYGLQVMLKRLNNIDINIPDKNGNTLLMYAVMNKNKKMIRYLFYYYRYIDLYAINSDQETIFHLAEQSGFDLWPYVKMRGASKFLEKALKSDNVPLANLVLKNNIKAYEPTKIYFKKKAGAIPFLYFLYNTKYFFLFNLVLYDVEHDINQTDGSGRTALFYATQAGMYDLVYRLLQAGADGNKKQKERMISPLSAAVIQQNVPIVQLLIKHGVIVDCRDEKNRTPLMYAFKKNNKTLVELLLRAKANLFLKDSDGKMAYEYVETNEMARDLVNLINDLACEKFFKGWSYWPVHTPYCFKSLK